jgi:hypothetical protein
LVRPKIIFLIGAFCFVQSLPVYSESLENKYKTFVSKKKVTAQERRMLLREVFLSEAALIDGIVIDEAVERVLGMSFEQVDEKLREDKTEARQAMYKEHTYTKTAMPSKVDDLQKLRKMIEIKAGDRIIDFGSGVGIPGFFFATLYPDSENIGYEIVPEKVAAAERSRKRLGLKNLTFVEQDLGADDFKVPDADIYYLYSPTNKRVTRRLVQGMRAVAVKRKLQKKKPIRVVIVVSIRYPEEELLEWLDLEKRDGFVRLYRAKD